MSERDKLKKIIKENPRKRKAWDAFNKQADQILKECLEDSEFLNFNPKSWLKGLYKAYFILRFEYWTNFGLNLKSFSIKEENPPFSNKNIVEFNKIIYIRVIILLIRISVDRIGIEEYDKLPDVPKEEKYQLMDIIPYVTPHFYIENIVMDYIDFIINNACKKIIKFLDFICSDDRKEKTFVNRNFSFPIPFILYAKYIPFMQNLGKIYDDRIFDYDKEKNKLFALEPKIPLPKEKIDKHHDSLKTIRENLTGDLSKILTLEKQGDERQIITILNTQKEELNRIFEELYQKLSHVLGDFEKEILENNIDKDLDDFFCYGANTQLEKNTYTEFMHHPTFSTHIMKKIVENMEENISKFTDNDAIFKFEKLIKIFEPFLFDVFNNKDTLFVFNEEDLKTVLKSNYIDYNDFLDFVIYPNQHTYDISNPLKCKDIFKYSYNMMIKPILKDRKNRVYYSFYILYDSLVYHYTKILQNRLIGVQRGMHAELYTSQLIREYSKMRFGKDNFKIFKLIFQNANPKHRSKNYDHLESNLKLFSEEIIKIDLTTEEFGNSISFIEYDLVLLVNEVMVIIEVKDDLFWEIVNLPHFMMLWGINIKEKNEKQKSYLLKPKIKDKLKSSGIIFSKLESMVLTQGNIVHPDFKTINDFYNLLDDIYFGKDYFGSFRFGPLPKYEKKID